MSTKLPGSICPVPPEEDCPVRALAGGLFVLVLGALVLASLLGLHNLIRYGQWQRPGYYAPEKMQPVEIPVENPYKHFAKFSKHWDTCAQCNAPLINSKGEQSAGFCEEGFRLLQEDVRNNRL